MNPRLYKTKWKEDFKKTHWRRAYIYICWQKHHKKLIEREFHYWEKSWGETRAYRDIFEVETKTENILRVNKGVYEVFGITDL